MAGQMFSSKWSIGNHCNLNILLKNCKPVVINPIVKRVCSEESESEEISENCYLNLARLILTALPSAWPVSKLYIPSTLNINFILWHPQLIVDALKC